MTNWLDEIANPLLSDLSEHMNGTADSGLFKEWVEGAVDTAENLWRVSEADGAPPQATNAVALYTGSIDGVYLGNLAADASLRNSGIVALDTTNLGRLIINLDRAVETMSRAATGLEIDQNALNAADDLLRNVFGDLGETQVKAIMSKSCPPG